MTDKEILQGIDKLEDGVPFDEIRNGDKWLDIHELLSEVRERIKEWHYPSKGELPPNGGDYLVCIEYEDRGYIRVGQYFGETGWYTDLGEVYGYWTPIAWMTFPEPPKEE